MSNPYALDFSPIAALGQQAYQVGAAERSAALEQQRYNQSERAVALEQQRYNKSAELAALQEKRSQETFELKKKIEVAAFTEQQEKIASGKAEIDVSVMPMFSEASPSVREVLTKGVALYGGRVVDGRILIPRNQFKEYVMLIEKTPDMMKKIAEASILDEFGKYQGKENEYKKAEEALRKKMESGEDSWQMAEYQKKLQQLGDGVKSARDKYQELVGKSSIGVARSEVNAIIDKLKNVKSEDGTPLWDKIPEELQIAFAIAQRTGDISVVNEIVKRERERMAVGKTPAPSNQVWVNIQDPTKTRSVNVNNPEEKNAATKAGFQPRGGTQPNVTTPAQKVSMATNLNKQLMILQSMGQTDPGRAAALTIAQEMAKALGKRITFSTKKGEGILGRDETIYKLEDLPPETSDIDTYYKDAISRAKTQEQIEKINQIYREQTGREPPKLR